MSSSSLGNRDVISTTSDASQRYQYKSYPRQPDTNLGDSSPPPSTNIDRAGGEGDAIGNRPAPMRGALNPEISDLLSSSTASSSGHSPSSKRWVVSSGGMSRRLREFIPDFRKDQEYWQKRQKNNEAAKRSREKRRINDVVMGKRIYELSSENKRLRLELEAIKRHFGYPLNVPYPIDAATLAASTAPGRPESPMMFAAMSSAESDDDSEESSQSKQIVVSGGGGGSSRGLEYHRQLSSSQDNTTPPSSANQLLNQQHSLDRGAAPCDESSTYHRSSNITSSSAGRLGQDQYRQAQHRLQHYLPPAAAATVVKNSDDHLSLSSGQYPSSMLDSFGRLVPQSLDGCSTSFTHRTMPSTTSKSSAALARAEVLERFASSRALEQQMKSSEHSSSSRRYREQRGDGFERRGGGGQLGVVGGGGGGGQSQYYAHRRSPSYRSAASDVHSRSTEDAHCFLREDSVNANNNNHNNGAFISNDVLDEKSSSSSFSSWPLRHQSVDPPRGGVKVKTIAGQSRFNNDGDLGFSDVSSDADDAHVQFSSAERSRPRELRGESGVRRGLREAPLNLTKRLRMSALHAGGRGSGAEMKGEERTMMMRYVYSTTHDNEEVAAEMPPLIARSNRTVLSRSASGDVRLTVPSVNDVSPSPTTCSSAPVPQLLLRSPPPLSCSALLHRSPPSASMRSNADHHSPHYHSSNAELHWGAASSSSRGRKIPPLGDMASLQSLPNIGTLTPGSRALRYSRDVEPPIAQSLVAMATDNVYSSEYSDGVVSTRRRLKSEEAEAEDGSKSIEVINRHVRGGVPLKVWHKRSSAHTSSDDWPPLLEDGRYAHLPLTPPPHLERHGSTSELLFHSPRRDSEEATLLTKMNYGGEEFAQREFERGSSSKSISQSEGDVRVGDSDSSFFFSGGAGHREGTGEERGNLQAAVHLSTAALEELEGVSRQTVKQQQHQEASNFQDIPTPFD